MVAPANQCSRTTITRPLVNRTKASAPTGCADPNVSHETAEIDDTMSATLRDRVLRFIAEPSAFDFGTLALEVHAYQYRANPAYGRFVDRRHVPAPRTWQEIPAVPAEAFRLSALACGPAERVYQSSGTTAGLDHRARHYVPDVAAYRASALAGFARAVLPIGIRRRFLVAAPERGSHPHSSLGEMVSWLRETYDDDSIPSFLAPSGVDVERLAHTLDRLDEGTPIILLAVTSALLRLADWADARTRHWRLPSGSLVIDTGGCKGYERDLARGEILSRYRRALGIAAEHVVNEYGMTELASQLYATGDGVHRPPPWLRTLVCDLATGREVPAGTVGCLRHLDLANLGSVLAVQTEDLGRVRDGGIELLGRVPGAVSRGCSLLVDEATA
jgi:hypothetical protein